jgi:di/tricarboxylate transporter
MLGGMLTVFGTSTNILTNDLLVANGFSAFGIFDFIGLGALGLVVGIAYFLFIGRFILPSRFGVGTDSPEDSNKFLAELRILFNSKFIDKSIAEGGLTKRYDVEVLTIIRRGEPLSDVSEETVVEVDDVLVILSSEESLIELDELTHELLIPDFRTQRWRNIQDGVFVKVLFRARSLEHKTKSLSELNFYRRYGVLVIGLHRNRESVINNPQKITDIQLRSGEVFLAKVMPSQLASLKKSRDLMVLEEFGDDSPKVPAWKAIGVLALVIGLAMFNVVPLMVAALLGVLLLFMLQCISAEEIYSSVHWNVIFLLAGVIPLGIALQNTGAVSVLASSIALLAVEVPVIVFLGILYLFTTLITEVISNNAAVVLMVPIVLTVALELGINPHAVALIIMFAASTSFLSPVGYQTNAMVYSAGGYRFSDFIKVGAPLNILLLIIMTTAIYMLY